MKERITKYRQQIDRMTFWKWVAWNIRKVHIWNLVHYPLFGGFLFFILGVLIGTFFAWGDPLPQKITGGLSIVWGFINSFGVVGPILKHQIPGRFPGGEPVKGKFLAYVYSGFIAIMSILLFITGIGFILAGD